jgi:hypothetical protein
VKAKKQIVDDTAIERCKAAFDTTNWSMFITDDIDHTVEAVTDYINFTLSSNSTCKEFYTNNNHRPWVTSELKLLFNDESQALKSKNRYKAKQIQKLINQKIAKAKAKYKDKMLSNMSSNIKKAWHGIKSMSGLPKPKDSNHTLMTEQEQTTLASSLNTFYTRFNSYTPCDGDTDDVPKSAAENASPSPNSDEPPTITVDEVRKQFLRCKVGKSSGPDNLSTKILKSCAYELAPVFCDLFNFCMIKGVLPRIWKLSSIVPVPKFPSAKEDNDFRPIALTSVATKCFEHYERKTFIFYQF